MWCSQLTACMGIWLTQTGCDYSLEKEDKTNIHLVAMNCVDCALTVSSIHQSKLAVFSLLFDTLRATTNSGRNDDA